MIYRTFKDKELSLLGFGADIHIIAPEISEEIQTLAKDTKNNISFKSS